MPSAEAIAGKSHIDGRFAPGNRLGQGNPNARKMYELRRSILDATTEGMVKEVWARVVHQALDGCVASQKLFLEMTCGKAVQPVEISGPDHGPISVQSILARITVALNDMPEARFKVAAALHGLSGEGESKQESEHTEP
jgi:hypothetical protein